MFIGQIDNQRKINFSKSKYPGVKKLPSGKVEKAGEVFDGFNKPKADTKTDHKKVVLAKDGDKVKIVRYGKDGYRHNYSPKAKKNYLKRSGGIKDKSGKLTKNNKLSSNFWARKDLWPSNKKADGKSLS